ncbi:phage holin family protein [Denitrovibrio acetiphilus]|nr:phage holin family protein [Denitrovibrio acetiphilus]
MQPVHYIFYRACVNLIGIGIASLIISGISVSSFIPLFIAGIVLTLFQTFLRPILFFLTLPFQILSMGIGYIIINSFLLKLTADFLSGIDVSGFWAAFFGALIISFINMLFDLFSSRSKVQVYYHKGGDDD